MSWKFWEKSNNTSDEVEYEVNFTENVQYLLNEQEKIEIPVIERKFTDVLNSRKEVVFEKSFEKINNFIEIYKHELTGKDEGFDIDIARRIKLLTRQIANICWHEFRNAREEYLEEVYNTLQKPYSNLRELVKVDSNELRDDIDEYDRDSLYYENIASKIIEGYSERMAEDRLEFKEHAIQKAKGTTKLPRHLNERKYQ